jgi:hypothetical protein
LSPEAARDTVQSLIDKTNYACTTRAAPIAGL